LRSCAAFTLMEVNVALALVAIGLLGLLSLCSVGLRQSKQATSDTAQAAFADSVFNAMHANANSSAMNTNYSAWATALQFRSGGHDGTPLSGSALFGVTMPPDAANPTLGQIQADGQQHTVSDFPVTGHNIVYTLSVIQEGATPPWYRATMQVSDNKYMNLANAVDVFSTDFVYMGM